MCNWYLGVFLKNIKKRYIILWLLKRIAYKLSYNKFKFKNIICLLDVPCHWLCFLLSFICILFLFYECMRKWIKNFIIFTELKCHSTQESYQIWILSEEGFIFKCIISTAVLIMRSLGQAKGCFSLIIFIDS
jgi:hypothetical protein